MAYSIIEQTSQDLDIFFRDKKKFIHIASGGGQLPAALATNDLENEEFRAKIDQLKSEFRIEVNPLIGEITKVDEKGIAEYLKSFSEMAQRGFYSYDKTVLGDFENPFYHLVARPLDDNVSIAVSVDLIREINRNLPITFQPFNLFSYF